MKIFMLGWEFPPFISGGLGTACYGLTKAMSKLGLEVTFVLPRSAGVSGMTTHVVMRSPADIKRSGIDISKYEEELKNIKVKTIDSALRPYARPESYQQEIEDMIKVKRQSCNSFDLSTCPESQQESHYAGDMYTEIHRYAAAAVHLAMQDNFDIVHAHDWMTYPAGIAVAAVSGKPLVIHVHSTEFDRSGEHVNQTIYDIERRGMHAADRIIAVSYLTRSIIISRYGVTGDKVEVVHNGVERGAGTKVVVHNGTEIKQGEKIVLFLGRITMQKGPEYFLGAAKKVLEIIDNVKFVMAGSGDMMRRSIEIAAEMGIGSKVLFTGFLRGEDVQKIYQMADLYVMPSVSEPFGIAPLEALNHDVPVLISKQSGVSEVLTHALKVDFWDVDEIANKIVAVLRHSPLEMTLKEHGNFEVRKLRWEESAQKCAKIYAQTVCV